MSEIEVLVENGSVELFEIFRGTNIAILSLKTAECASLSSKILYTLEKLTKLYLWGTYSERCTLQLPATLQCISLQKVECSAEWLCSLLIALSSLDHSVECELWDVVLQPCADECGDDSQARISDSRSEMQLHDMSEIKVLVKNGSVELFEIFRGTNIGILKLKTAECASLSSKILYTLKKLTKLYLWGTYSERCTLQLPATLQCISLQTVECSAKWLCSLLISLSSLDHSVNCELYDVVLQPFEDASGDDSHVHVSDLRSEILSCDMPLIEILLEKGSAELFEIFRGTNIGILTLKTAECASLASKILYTLKKLTKLYLWGTFSERSTLQLPATLQCISLQTVECSAEWLCSLLIALSSLDHSVKCELYDVVLQPCAEQCGDDSQARISDSRSEIPLHDMSKIEVLVENGSVELFEIFRGTNIAILTLEIAECASLSSKILYTFKKLTTLYLWGTYSERCTLQLPATLQCISLQTVECSAEWLCGLLIALSSLDHSVKCELYDVVLQPCAEQCGDDSQARISDSRSEIPLHDMSKIEVLVENGSVELFEIFRGTNIAILTLEIAECASLASKILYTFKKLTTLYLWGTYSERCTLQLPATLQCISLQTVECSAKWLCSLLISLSSLDHSVKCELYDVVLQPFEDASGDDSHVHVSDLRSEILSCDMSLIEIYLNNGNVELFEIFRGTNIGILKLKTAECASLSSKILYTLKKLTTLYLWGTYSERCTLQLPATLQCISLQTVECSAKWLCSLLISLSSLDHSVKCELYDVVLQPFEDASGDDSHVHVSDLRSEILSCDMSLIEILLKKGSVELFEIFRGTNIGILKLKTAECASLASKILYTLKKLTKLYLWGTYSERSTLQLPATLQCISLQTVECSAEWLCGLLIALSSLDHSVKCELYDVVLQPCAEQCGDDSQARISDSRSEIPLHDMSKIDVLVENGSVELFEIFRGTNIGILKLKTAECASLSSKILYTLEKLTKLYLWGTYSERCTLQLPATLQCISLQTVECSAEWLCSLLIALSLLDHSVKCELWDVVLQPCEDASGDDVHVHESDLRSEILSCDMSLIEIYLNNGSVELFEIFRGTNIGILKLKTAECASLSSKILYTLEKLTTLYLWGSYSERCTLQLPATLQCISLQTVECSAKWLCSLLISLSSLDHSVECELWDIVLQPCADECGGNSQTHVSDLRTEMVSLDMSQTTILVKNGSSELFEIFRGTNIGILTLKSADCASLSSQILHTLKKLTKLVLWGTYSGRCTLQLPDTLQCISLQDVECSAEWLCSLLIELSSLDHYVECELRDVVLQPCEFSCGDD
ncbi:hypothetical protein DPMN_139623 [Dreissena polymorpha]|uniref:Uncharacterized protein n=1 Tax=Dreissena polymorpha TaxID=45954 RepID=A0A9D4G691_DREPO|nr:hypothetical protein DPMN_139623 [Dreissena polymorpha]